MTLGVLPALTCDFRYVLEVGELDVLHVAHLVHNPHHRRRQFPGVVGTQHGHGNVRLDAAQLFEKVDVEVGAAKLAVRDALHTNVFLELHDLADGLVLDLAQLLRRDGSVGLLLAGFQQVFGAQKTTYVVVAGG